MKASLALLIGGTLAVWLVVVYPAQVLWGDSALLFSATACAVCLVPTALTLVWCYKAYGGTPEHQLLAVLGGTGVRIVFVMTVGMILYNFHPDFQYQRFWFWLIGFYLVTLTLEVILVARHAEAAHSSKN